MDERGNRLCRIVYVGFKFRLIILLSSRTCNRDNFVLVFKSKFEERMLKIIREKKLELCLPLTMYTYLYRYYCCVVDNSMCR